MATTTWITAANGDFAANSNWSGGSPVAADDAVLAADGGSPYTASSAAGPTVNSIATAANATLAITAGTFTATNGTGTGVNAGTISIGSNSNFSIGGTFNNSGTVSLNSYSPSQLIIAANTTLTGGGQINMTNAGGAGYNNVIYGVTAATNLTNVDNTISGGGKLGNGQMTLVNQAAGTINATNGSQQLVISTGANTAANAGLIEATGGAGLLIASTKVDNGTAGIIQAVGSHVDLQSATIAGGTLKSSASGYIRTIDNGSVLDGTTNAVNNQALLNIDPNTSLTTKGTINNTGSINLNSYNASQLVIGANTSLTGGGQINMTDAGGAGYNNVIYGATAATTLTNVDNTISGGGKLGNGQMTLINQLGGKINANSASQQLVINTGANTVVNAGLIKATGAAGLRIVSTKINDTSGSTILADNSHVDLQSATIIGGFLKTANGGLIQTVDNGSILDGSTTTVSGTTTVRHPVTVLGNVVINQNTALTIQGGIVLTQKVGTVVTNGIITLNAYSASQLIVGSKGAQLTGSQIIMSDAGGASYNNQINGTLKTGTKPTVSKLTNISTMIVGAGHIGTNLLLANSAKGIINANSANNALIIETGNSTVAKSNVVANAGLLESTTLDPTKGVGGLLIRNTVISNSSSGIVEANGAHTHVDLTTATIAGGTLKTLGGGIIQTMDNGSILDGTLTAVNNQAAIVVNASTSLTLKGTINNTGSISLNAYNAAQLIMGANTTLTGGGAINMTDVSGAGYNNLVFGVTAATTLTNVNNTISGDGKLGNGQLTLINQTAGTINASSNSQQLVIDTGGSAVTNAGIIKATGSSGLTISGGVANSGTISAAGGNVYIGGAVTGSGSEALNGASSLEDASAVSNNVSFAVGATGTLKLDQAQNFTGSVSGFNSQNALDLANISDATTTLSYSGTTTSGVLTVADGTTTAHINLTGNYTAATFTHTNDGAGHAKILVSGTGLSATLQSSSKLAVTATTNGSAFYGNMLIGDPPAATSASKAQGLVSALAAFGANKSYMHNESLFAGAMNTNRPMLAAARG